MRRGIGWRWFKFEAVGAVGIAVQLASLACLREGLGLSVMAATAMAVEISILTNFLLHRHWTWAGREQKPALRQLCEFNLTYSLASITVNLIFTPLYMRSLGVHYLIANLMAICTGGVANFLLGEFLVFRPMAANQKGEAV